MASAEVRSCNVYHCADSGLVLSGGDRKTLRPGRHRAADNHAHHMGEWSRCYQPGIHVLGMSQRIEHNLTTARRCNGILLSGNEHIIRAQSHSPRLPRERRRRRILHGPRLERMRQRASLQFFPPHSRRRHGIDGRLFRRLRILDYDLWQYILQVHAGRAHWRGRNNRIENNIFIECEPAIHLDGRGLDESPYAQSMVLRR